MMTPTAHGEYRGAGGTGSGRRQGLSQAVRLLAEVSECVRTSSRFQNKNGGNEGKASNKQQSMQTNGAYKVSAARFYCVVAVNCWSGRLRHQYETGAMRRLHVRGLGQCR